ncbi:unnamed protein product [Caenorhabditis sp. 36 PRJEB53466]|nr:unnamed protein product [Caenorhabditis sp. 36 PRJEB53466]
MNDPSPSPPNNLIIQANPQIAAALAVTSPMQQQGVPPQHPGDQQFMGSPPQPPMGMSGPIRIQPMQQKFLVRPMPYPNQQMRVQGPPPGNPHFSPMGMQQQQQFAQNGQPMQMSRPMAPPPGQGGQMPMGMQAGPSGHPMGMGGPPPHMVQQQGGPPPQFVHNSSPMPPQPLSRQDQYPPMGQERIPPPQPPLQQQTQPPLQQQQQPIMMTAVTCGAIMDKIKLDELMAQISTTTVLEENVKEVLIEYADDFVSALIDKACKMIKHREVKKIESRDIEFILKNCYNMPVAPRASTQVFGGHSESVIDLSKEKHIPTEAHKQRLALLKKQIRKV